MSRRPSRSPPRRESDGGAIYRGIHDKPRDLLIFSCNPKTCALPGLDEEVHAVQRAFKRSADVRHVRNLDPKELQKELLSRPPRCFMFVGHANAEVDGAKTLAFCTGKDRELCAVTPETLAKLLGEFSPARGGPLRLVFLNGCQSEALGRAVLDAGVPHVVCWSTIVETKAAAAFSEGFFRAMEEGCDVAGAFEQAKLAVTLIPKHGVVSGSMPGFVPKYELRDPRLGVPSLVTTPSGRLAAGIPLHLTSESVAATAATSSTPAAGWLGSGWALAARATTRLKRGVTSLIDGLLDAAEWRAKQTIGSDLRTQTAPQSLEALSLKEGDTIYVEVTIGFWSTVEWPTRVLGSRKVLWDAMPSVDPVAFGKPTEGNIRFVLTHQGLRIYDEDFALYYKWRRSPLTLSPPPDPARGAVQRYSARGVLLLLVVGACAALRYPLRLLLLMLSHLMLPLLGRPSLMLALVLAALSTYIFARAAIRYATEDDAEEVEAE